MLLVSGNFVAYVGGASQAPSLLPPLETLATVEETVVREKARAKPHTHTRTNLSHTSDGLTDATCSSPDADRSVRVGRRSSR